MAPYLSPVEHPRGLRVRLVYFFTRRQFGKVPTPISVFSARMPWSFMAFYAKVSRLDKKLELPEGLSALVRERVASITGCHFCMDAARWSALRQSAGNVERFDALAQYRSSPLFSEAERAALDYASQLTADHRVGPETFDRLTKHFGERQICDLVWLVASEHLYNLSNIGLDIGSDNLCPVEPRRAMA